MPRAIGPQGEGVEGQVPGTAAGVSDGKRKLDLQLQPQGWLCGSGVCLSVNNRDRPAKAYTKSALFLFTRALQEAGCRRWLGLTMRRSMSLRCFWPFPLCSERAAVVPGITSPDKAGRSRHACLPVLSEEHQLSRSSCRQTFHCPSLGTAHPGCRGGRARENLHGSPQ